MKESDYKKQMDKNFGLAEEVFDAMIIALQRGNDDLFEKIFLSHFKDCCQYLMKTYGASPEDAHDASMDTLVEFHSRLMTGKVKYGNLRFLFTRMAGQVYFKWIKKEKLKSGLDGFDLPDVPMKVDREDMAVLNRAWAGLCEDCQKLLKSFYYQKITLDKVANDLGNSPAAVRKRKQRCVEKLRNLFVKLS